MLQLRNYPISTVNEAAGLIVTDWVEISPVRCKPRTTFVSCRAREKVTLTISKTGLIIININRNILEGENSWQEPYLDETVQDVQASQARLYDSIIASIPRGQAGAACSEGRRCSSWLVCRDSICVRPSDPDESSVVADVRVLPLGSLEAATAAEATLKRWKGRHVRVSMKDGTVVEDVLATTRLLKLYLSKGQEISLEDAAEVSLVD